MPRIYRRAFARTEADHRQEMAKLDTVDRQIDALLHNADVLVTEFGKTLDRASAVLRGTSGEVDRDSGERGGPADASSDPGAAGYSI